MIAERLLALRKEHGMSKRDLVSKLPLNYSTYANYESGFREPNSEVLQMLSIHYGVSLDYLFGISENRKKADEIAILNEEENQHIIKYRQLDAHGKEIVDIVLEKEVARVSFLNTRMESVKKPLIDNQWIKLRVYNQNASTNLGDYLNNETNFEEMNFMATQVSEKADFCIRIKGESMEPKICDGDIVFVKAVPRVDPDNVGIFVYDGEVYCKRLRIDTKKGELVLESLNKSFAPNHIPLPENLHTVGLVIGIAE